MHSYSVQLRITGDDLLPDEVTGILNLQPCQTRVAGQRRGQHSVWDKSLWSYNGGDASQNEWHSLEDGLNFLMEKLYLKKELIGDLADRYEVIWWCGHFQSSFDGGPTFSKILLSRLSEFGVPLFLDNYFSNTEE